MKKALFYWFAFLLTLLFMTSCKSKANLVRTETTKDEIIETVKDTVFNVPADSSAYRAQLDCKDGEIVVKSISNVTAGRKMKSPKVTIKNNVLEVDCYSEAEKMFASWKEKFLKSFKISYEPIVTNELTWWQETQIKMFWILLVVLILWIIILIIKSKIFSHE